MADTPQTPSVSDAEVRVIFALWRAAVRRRAHAEIDSDILARIGAAVACKAAREALDAVWKHCQSLVVVSADGVFGFGADIGIFSYGMDTFGHKPGGRIVIAYDLLPQPPAPPVDQDADTRRLLMQLEALRAAGRIAAYRIGTLPDGTLNCVLEADGCDYELHDDIPGSASRSPAFAIEGALEIFEADQAPSAATAEGGEAC